MQDIPNAELLKKGRMAKSPLEMSSAERKAWYKQIQERAKNYLFSIGQPLVYEKDGVMIAEYKDGKLEHLR